MIDFGSSNDHNKYITFGDSSVVGYMDGFWGVTILVRLKLKSSSGSYGYVIGKQGASPSTGWGLRFEFTGYGTKPEFFYHSGVDDVWRFHRCTTALTVDDWYTLGFSWRGDQYGFWYLNSEGINTTNSGAAGNDFVKPGSSVPLFVCGAGGTFLTHGAAVEMDNLIVIPNLRLRSAGTAKIAADFHAGYIEPWALQDRWQRSRDADPGILGPWFWWTGEYTPGYNILKHSKGGHEAGSTPAGTPAAIKDHCDNPPWIFLDLGGAPSMSSGAKPTESKVGKMPAKMYAEVTGRNRTYLGLKLELPDNNDLGFSMSSLPTSEQEYAIKVKSWSPISRETSDKEGRLTPVETSVVVVDPDRTLSRLLAGSLDGRAEGSPAKIRLVSPHVDPSSWMTVYEGELRRWEPRGNLPEITVHLGPNDKPLRSENNLGYITRDLYADVPAETEGQPMQIVYGTFDSVVGGGPISCPKVSGDGKRYLLSVGMVTPLQVYKAGTMLDPRSEYKIVRCKERAGRWFTEIVLNSDAGSDAITADVDGPTPSVYEFFNDYPYTELPEDWHYGVPIANPAEQLLHILVNFVFGAHEQGSWLSPTVSTPIDTESFIAAASWFRCRGTKGHTIVYGNETGYQLINRWATQCRIPVFWNAEGKLALKVDDFAVVRGGQASLIDREHGITDLVTSLDDSALADKVTVRHGYDWIDEKFDEETRAEDFSRNYDIGRQIDQDWSVA